MSAGVHFIFQAWGSSGQKVNDLTGYTHDFASALEEFYQSTAVNTPVFKIQAEITFTDTGVIPFKRRAR